MDNTGYRQERLQDIVAKEAREEQQKEQQQKEVDIDLTRQEHKRALKGAFRSFVIPGVPKAAIDTYFDQAQPRIKALIKEQLKEMESAKIIMTLWVGWKKPVELAITLHPGDVEGAQDIGRNTSNNYTRGRNVI